MTDRFCEKRDFRVKQRYYQWLLEMIDADSPEKDSYNLLLRKLWLKKFYYILPMDQNREKDGMALRKEFKEDFGDEFTDYSSIESNGCSVLEMMIGLANRINKQIIRKSVAYWFWKMIDNIGLWDCTDDRFGLDGSMYVDDVIENFLDRTYKRNGLGGLFPVKTSRKDQRKVEIWYQMQQFLTENYAI